MGLYFESYQFGNEVFCDISNEECVISDTTSRIVCKEFEILECGGGICGSAVINNGLILCECTDSWNCNLCGNDLPYFNIINPGENMVFQFQQIDGMNGNDPNGLFPYGWGTGGFVDGFIKDCCNGEYLEDGLGNPVSLTDYATKTFVGVFPVTDYIGNTTWKNIQMIEFNTAQLYNDLIAQFPDGRGCFVLEFCFDLGLASEYCFCSEPYVFNPCPNEKTTILLEGVYPEFDCFRYYYGTQLIGNGTPFAFYNQYRVEGAFEQTSFAITKEFVGTKLKTTTSEIQENWILKTNRIPQRVAKLMTNLMNAESVFVDGIEYVVDGEIPKNNEIGNQWFIDVAFRKIDCSKTYSCK